MWANAGRHEFQKSLRISLSEVILLEGRDNKHLVDDCVNKVKKSIYFLRDMIFTSTQILNTSRGELLAMLRKSKYVGYRLGDFVLNFPCERQAYLDSVYKNHLRLFPTSLAVNYSKKYLGKVSLGHKIGRKMSLTDSLKLLLQLCDELNVTPPPADALVATIRLGDMIELNSQGRNGRGLAIHGGTFATRNGGTRQILSAHQIIEFAKSHNLSKVVLLGSKAIGTGEKSVDYLVNVIKIIEAHNIVCEWFYSESPDEDLAFASYARHIITGPGGFCLIAGALSNFRHGKDEVVHPIPEGINFK